MHVTDAKPAKGPTVLLATKVQPPRAPSGLVERPRLVALATQVMSRRLTVVKAPAGFGKTSLTLAWLKPLLSMGAKVGWLALDIDDDEPARFFHHFAQALRNACGNVGASTMRLTSEASLVPAQAFVPMLINELVEVDDDVCLFIDDYHLVSDPGIHEAVAFLVEHAPSHVHVIVSTRVDPPFPLGRLRARNDVLEIDASDLRFDLDETRALVEHEWPGMLGTNRITHLHANTEGWAAALRISASVLSRETAQDGTVPATPSGASRPFAAYLEDVLMRLPAGMLAFMLRTSMLDELSAPLCEAVTGVAKAQAMLEAIVARQVLLEPTDLEGRHFRYHRLMAEYLVQRLETQHADERADLHRRAYRWYAEREQWTEAVKHAIAAGANDDAVSMMGQCAKALVAKGDLLTLLGWQRQFPAPLMQQQVRVRLAIAWGMALAMRFGDARSMLHAIEADEHTDPERVQWECSAIRAVVEALEDDPERALHTARACLSMTSTDTWATNVLSNVIRFAHWKAGDLEALHATPWIPDSSEGDPRNAFNAVYRLCLLGHAEMQQMRFALAERYFADSMRLAERSSGPNSIAAALCVPMIGHLRYEQGDIDGAEALVIDHMPVIDSAVLLDSVLFAYRLLVRVAFARHQAAHAYALLDRAQAIGHARRWDRLVAGAAVERTRLYLAEGRIIEAAGCVSQLDALAAPSTDALRPVSHEIATYRALATAYLAMARQQTQVAIEILQDALHDVEQRHGTYMALRLRTVLALAWFQSDERELAVDRLREVLAQAEGTGIYRSILDQGPTMVPLLQAVRESKRPDSPIRPSLAYVDRLLDGFDAPRESDEAARHIAGRESLSTRERRIVALIAQGQSNKEIARTLGIAPETVKTHVKNIFVKLDVDKRAHAVMRAQALGLVANA